MTRINLLGVLFIAQLFSYSNIQPDSVSSIENKLELAITFPNTSGVDECLNVTVLIINRTDTVVSFFEDWNSYGYYNIRFEVKSGGETFLLSKFDRDWPKNFPSFKTLFPGDTMVLSFSLNYDTCINSQFSGPALKEFGHLASIKAIYQQSKDALEYANLKGKIKYKQIYKSAENPKPRRPGEWIIIDSLKVPVEVNRTFPLSKLESKDYQLSN